MAINRVGQFLRPKLLVPIAIAAAGLAAVPLTTQSKAAPQATTASSCTLQVAARIEVNSRYYAPTPTMKLGPDCAAAGETEAKWEAKTPEGTVRYRTWFRYGDPTTLRIFDNTALGQWTWRPAGAFGTGDISKTKSQQPDASTPGPAKADAKLASVSLTQNTPVTDVRMQSRAHFLSVPMTENCFYNVKLQAERYAITPHSMIPYAGISGSIQRLSDGSSTWVVTNTFTTNSAGQYIGKYPVPKTGARWRAVLYDAQYIFGSINWGPTDTGGDPSCPG